MKKTLGILCFCALTAGAVWLGIKLIPGPGKAIPESAKELAAATVEKGTAKEKKLTGVIEKYKSSKDVNAQDVVAKARMELGYALARKGDWKASKQAFLTAAKEYKGTGSSHPDYGRIDDQATYQSIVATEAAGNKKEAIDGYKTFMQSHQTSPLIFAAKKRLAKIDPKNIDANSELFERANAARSKKIQKDLALCGPKVLQVLFNEGDIDTLAKECGTTDVGTTMSGMAKALANHGWKSEGMLVNDKDFRAIAMPFIWLNSDHYALVKSIEGDACTIYDPMYGERTVDLSKNRDTFEATILKINK